MFQRGAAGGERVGGDHLDPFREQVVPAGDPLRVAGADGEDDDRVGHHPLVLVGVPVLGDQTRFDEAGDVRLEGEGDDVGRQPAFHGAALLAGGGERGLELDARSLRRRLEEGDDLLVGLARGGVGDEGEGDPVLRGGRRAASDASAGAAAAAVRASERLAAAEPGAEKPIVHEVLPFVLHRLSPNVYRIPFVYRFGR